MDKTLSQLEDAADNLLRHSKSYIPHLARLCLISTFLDDAIRMWFQWTDQADYVNVTWRCGAFVANMFVLWNMVAQLVGCGMVLIRKMVPVAVGILFAVIVIQVSSRSAWAMPTLPCHMNAGYVIVAEIVFVYECVPAITFTNFILFSLSWLRLYEIATAYK